jgi:hypothetical protein
MEQGPCDIEEEEIYYDAPSESTDMDTENDTPVDFASNASIIIEEVADEEPTVEEPVQTILTDIIPEGNVRKRSVSSPAIFTSPIEEVAVVEFISVRSSGFFLIEALIADPLSCCSPLRLSLTTCRILRLILLRLRTLPLLQLLPLTLGSLLLPQPFRRPRRSFRRPRRSSPSPL